MVRGAHSPENSSGRRKRKRAGRRKRKRAGSGGDVRGDDVSGDDVSEGSSSTSSVDMTSSSGSKRAGSGGDVRGDDVSGGDVSGGDVSEGSSSTSSVDMTSSSGSKQAVRDQNQATAGKAATKPKSTAKKAQACQRRHRVNRSASEKLATVLRKLSELQSLDVNLQFVFAFRFQGQSNKAKSGALGSSKALQEAANVVQRSLPRLMLQHERLYSMEPPVGGREAVTFEYFYGHESAGSNKEVVPRAVAVVKLYLEKLFRLRSWKKMFQLDIGVTCGGHVVSEAHAAVRAVREVLRQQPNLVVGPNLYTTQVWQSKALLLDFWTTLVKVLTDANDGDNSTRADRRLAYQFFRKTALTLRQLLPSANLNPNVSDRHSHARDIAAVLLRQLPEVALTNPATGASGDADADAGAGAGTDADAGAGAGTDADGAGASGASGDADADAGAGAGTDADGAGASKQDQPGDGDSSHVGFANKYDGKSAMLCYLAAALQLLFAAPDFVALVCDKIRVRDNDVVPDRDIIATLCDADELEEVMRQVTLERTLVWAVGNAFDVLRGPPGMRIRRRQQQCQRAFKSVFDAFKAFKTDILTFDTMFSASEATNHILRAVHEVERWQTGSERTAVRSLFGYEIDELMPPCEVCKNVALVRRKFQLMWRADTANRDLPSSLATLVEAQLGELNDAEPSKCYADDCNSNENSVPGSRSLQLAVAGQFVIVDITSRVSFTEKTNDKGEIKLIEYRNDGSIAISSKVVLSNLPETMAGKEFVVSGVVLHFGAHFTTLASDDGGVTWRHFNGDTVTEHKEQAQHVFQHYEVDNRVAMVMFRVVDTAKAAECNSLEDR